MPLPPQQCTGVQSSPAPLQQVTKPQPMAALLMTWLCVALVQVAAIFGFCDVRQFTDATEVLQEDVMEFVNSIARIVHMEVSLHGGAPNKNVGDAFLLVHPSSDALPLSPCHAELARPLLLAGRCSPDTHIAPHHTDLTATVWAESPRTEYAEHSWLLGDGP